MPNTNGKLTRCTVGDDDKVDGLYLFEGERVPPGFPPSGFFELLDIVSNQDVELVGNRREPPWVHVPE